MSNTEPDEQVIHREYPATLEPTGDGRTLELRIVPFNTIARVSDKPGEEYDEVWVPGCFDKQLNAANRVLVNFEHERGISNVVGRGVELRSDEHSLEGTFRVLGGPDGDKALELVNERVLTGVSLEAIPLRSERGSDGIVKRVRARLLNIALCRTPAFKDAVVLAVRDGEPDDDGEPDEPAPDGDGDSGDSEPVPAASVERSDVELALTRVGFEAIVQRAIVRRPWDGSASRFEDDEWRRSCLLDRGDQFDTTKTRYALPVLEPNGDLNVNGMHAAAARLGQVDASPSARASAARKLVRYYRQAGETPPPAVTNAARR